MTDQPELNQPRRAPSLINLGARAFFALGGIFLGLVAFWMWLSWQDTRDASLQRTRITVALAGGQAQSYFDSVGAGLHDLADGLRQTDPLAQPEAALALLRRFKERDPDLGAVCVIRSDGQVLLTTALLPGQPLPNVLDNAAWREDFYNNLKTGGLSVNRTRFSRPLQTWVIPVRLVVAAEDGRGAAYVLQASILVESQQALWKDLALPEGAVVGLMREDGYLLSRIPGEPSESLYLNKGAESGPLLAELGRAGLPPASRAATYHHGQVAGAYQRLRGYPLYTFISLPDSALRQIWWSNVRIPFFLLLGIFVLGSVSYGLIARRFGRRMGLIREKLDNAASAGAGWLPSSGVREIDHLCDALAQTQDRLRSSARNREKLLLSAAKAGTYAVRLSDGVTVEADQVFLDMLGMAEADVLDRSWCDLLARSADGDGCRASQMQPQDMARRILCFRNGGGREIWLSLAEYDEAAGGDTIRHGLAIDVSEREQLLSTVGSQSARFQALWQLATSRSKSEEEKAKLMLRLGLDTLNMDVVAITEVVGDRLVIRHLLDTLGIFRIGQEFDTCDDLCSLVVAAHGSFFVSDLAAHRELNGHRLRQQGIHVYASVPIRSADHIYGVLVFLRRLPLEGGFRDDDKTFMELLASWFEQLLLQQKQREVLQTQALTDTLTALPNRRAAELRFSEEIARAKRDKLGFSIATCDLDRFKLINDHYGHDVGDEVLRQVAQIMRLALREGDWVARWGGEEFIVFLHHSHSGDPIAAVERMRLAIKAQPLLTRQGKMEVTASFGVGVFRGENDDINRVLSESDGCLYEAKKKGRDCVVANEHANRSTLWTAGMLQHALQENRLVAAYQVMVDLATGQPVADEALARIVQKEGAILPAHEFIEAAEGINLIHAVDRAVAYQALARCSTNQQAGRQSPEFAHFINLSPQFLARKDMVDELMGWAQSLCSAPSGEGGRIKPVVLEITERQLLSDFMKLRRDLQPLLDFGLRLALDDFGSGYSSFLYLAELPVSFLKIEGWMVRNMRSNERVFHMVQSMVELSRTLGITTIAECIEDAETAELLRDIGVNWGQGYYFGRPELDQCCFIGLQEIDV